MGTIKEDDERTYEKQEQAKLSARDKKLKEQEEAREKILRAERGKEAVHFEEYVEKSGIKLGFELIFAEILENKIP